MPPSDPNVPPGIQRRILVVEDSDELRTLVCAVLARRGFAVMEANCGESALIVLACHAIDGVLTDVEMPGINGIELCHKLKRLESTFGRPIPVWIMTGSVLPNIDCEAQAAGAQGVFRKPFDANAVAESFVQAFALSTVVAGNAH